MANLRQIFLSRVAQTSDAPLLLEIEKAEGIYLYDTDGKSYIDLISGIAVSSLGHCHPAVVRAIKDQADKYLHTIVYGEYVLSPQVKLADLLTSKLPENLNCVYFVNSGSEATEGAMKLAKRYTGRPEIVSCFDAYHGSTQGSASLMSDSYFTQPYHPLLPGIKHIHFNEPKDLEIITKQTACVIIETVRAESGIHVPENDYLKKLRARCNETGTLLVFDEIQVGYGRTGSLFAFEQYDVVPDILLLAKGMGGGMPIGAFVADQKIMSVLSHNPVLGHITTFGGHPVCCAAALATLETIVESTLLEDMPAKSELLKELLVHPLIKEVRGLGLFMAIDLGSTDLVMKTIAICKREGLITDWFLFNDRCLRVAPPLVITAAEIRKACSIILAALDDQSLQKTS
ncbi:MAG: acetylornithine/N-succinyldiaminopimelate aminotransferase [Polaribacter sp.]|jgi:acetylornithine/succinyldiaminopimelate/putrescine aminotransferase